MLVNPVESNCELSKTCEYKETFESKYFSGNEDGLPMSTQRIMVKLWYWAITTLSTIGFGDLSP